MSTSNSRVDMTESATQTKGEPCTKRFTNLSFTNTPITPQRSCQHFISLHAGVSCRRQATISNFFSHFQDWDSCCHIWIQYEKCILLSTNMPSISSVVLEISLKILRKVSILVFFTPKTPASMERINLCLLHYQWWKPRGALTLESGRGICCAAVMTPLFQTSQCSLAFRFTIDVPLMCLPFSSFRKKFAFSALFWPKFSQDPSFFKENPLPRPYFWKPLWHTPTKKVECPPPQMKVDASKFCLFLLQTGLLHLKPLHPLRNTYCNFCTEGVCFLNGLTYLRNSIWNSPHPNVQHFGCIYHRGYQNFMW